MRLENYYENEHILHIGTMPEHAYFVPASFRLRDGEAHRETSDRLQFLKGEWDFHYYTCLDEVDENFMTEDFAADTYVPEQVPGTWQYYGYDAHQYTNVRYPFPIDPPYVPLNNPCGAYRTFFTYKKNVRNERAVLTFEGVDSCFYVWLNGVFVGYSQITHAQHEFDITQIVKEGENLLAVLVLKWCDGSYLEDQDKFRMTGIIRDVYIVKRPQDHIYDYRISTKLTGVTQDSYETCDRAEVEIDVTYRNIKFPVHAYFYDPEENLLDDRVFLERTTIILDNPQLWTAENPILYTLYLETEEEIITERIGLREITVKNQVVKVNGHPVIFRGVNRHDSDPFTGPVIGVDQIIKDMKLMKEHNIHAIRSSHYPNAPYFYQLCDRYGFYVIDEADNESHGNFERVLQNQTALEAGLRWNEVITDNPEFTEAITDRVRHLVIRDKNRPSVIIWSMGNEGGYGCTFEAALAWTKSYDPTRLTHYESAIYKSRVREYDYSNLDLHSRMYPSIDEIKDYVENVHERPFVLCEYSHAMGNGPGDLEDYYQIFDENPILCGGFVWEWCDHAIYKGRNEQGKEIYYYGGDHGEFLHDGNFCMDGLVYPDRTPHKGLLEYKNVNRPVRMLSSDVTEGMIQIQNKWNDIRLSDNVLFTYEINGPEGMTCSGDIPENCVPKLNPGESGILKLPEELIYTIKGLYEENPDGDWYLKITMKQKGDRLLTRDGHELGFEEILLFSNSSYERLMSQKSRDEESLSVREDERAIRISGNSFSYLFDKRHGIFEQIFTEGEELLQCPMDFTVWRAPTDNDREIRHIWERAFYDHTGIRAYQVNVEKRDGDCVEIECDMAMLAPSVQKILNMHNIWSVYGDGSIRLRAHVQKDPDFPVLPRFGLEIHLAEQYNKITYTGMGPHESYRDKHRASWHGRFETTVEELHEDYLKPQENGSHWDCSELVIFDGRKSLKVTGTEKYSFNASPYTAEELTKKLHNFELEHSGCTVLHIDYALNGIGSNSCGPEVLKKYQFDETTFDWDICLSIQ